MTKTGQIHSLESCGTVDGPGIRFVAFMQGCPLRCQYCHNPDTWKRTGGKEISPQALFNEIKKYKSYMTFSGGGFTATGGEPLLQADFLLEVFKKCQAEGIHTAIDTSGFIFNETIKDLLELTDLVLLDLKHIHPDQYKLITGVDLEPSLHFLDYLSSIKKTVWIRYVLVPGLTDQEDAIEDLGRHLSQYSNIEKIEVLPFHKMGEYKWKELGKDYRLANTQEPTKDSVLNAMTLLKKHNLNVVTN